MLATALHLLFFTVYSSLMFGGISGQENYPLEKGAHSIDKGERQNGDEVLYKELLSEQGQMRQPGKEYCYPPQSMNNPIRITEYEVSDKDLGGKGGVAFDVSGGVGQNQVCIYLKAKYGGSYSYLFTVYGHRLNNGGMGTGSFVSGNGNYEGMRTGSYGGSGNGNLGGTGSYGMPMMQGTGIGGYGSGLGTGYGSGNNMNNNYDSRNGGPPGNANPAFSNINSNPAFGNSNSNPSFGNSNPAFGNSNPAFGNSNPAFGNSNPAFGNSNPAFGNSNPAFGNSNPAFGNSNPAFGSSSSFNQGYNQGRNTYSPGNEPRRGY